jgi:hypothetical protein
VARAEGNLSRANVLRKIRGEPSPSPKDRNPLLHRHRHHDSNRIVREGVLAIEGAVMGFELATLSDLDPNEVPEWVASLKRSIRSLHKMIRGMTDDE